VRCRNTADGCATAARGARFFTCPPSRGRKQPVAFGRNLSSSKKHEVFECCNVSSSRKRDALVRYCWLVARRCQLLTDSYCHRDRAKQPVRFEGDTHPPYRQREKNTESGQQWHL